MSRIRDSGPERDIKEGDTERQYIMNPVNFRVLYRGGTWDVPPDFNFSSVPGTRY